MNSMNAIMLPYNQSFMLRVGYLLGVDTIMSLCTGILLTRFGWKKNTESPQKMAIPDYQSIMLPLLQLAGDGNEHSLQEAISTLSSRFNLTESERELLLPSGKQAVMHNRVGWARTYLRKACLLDSMKRGFFCISPRGLEVLATSPERIDVPFLRQYSEFRQFQSGGKDISDFDNASPPVQEQTPEETLENAHAELMVNLSDEILSTIKKCSPAFFERLVIELLVAMGYGGSMKEAGQALGKSGDGGIDGIIKEDRLGLDIIYVQAKRWDSVVGRPEIQKFAGALQGNRSRKGVFLTTSSFSKEAMEFVSHIESKIILLDGAKLTEFMIEHNVGVTSVETYVVKRLDSDYFSEG